MRAALIGIAALALSAKAPAPSLSSPKATAMDALAEEIARAKTLSTEGLDPPYFVGCLLRDVRRLEVSGKVGAIYSSHEDRSRWLRTDVRVGTYEMDSSAPGSSRGTRVTSEDDPVALRTAAWLQMDAAYKSALRTWLNKKTRAIDEPPKKERPPDFARETPAVASVPRESFPVDRAEAEEIVRTEGAWMKQFEWLFDSSVTVSMQEITKQLATSEGTRVSETRTIWYVHVAARAFADDGQVLNSNQTVYASHQATKPSRTAIHAAIKAAVDDLDDLRHADVLTPYSGPAVLSPQATGIFFHEAIGHQLEGHRDAEEERAITFEHRVGEQLLPPFITVRDDPSMERFEGADLIGHYAWDDEGIPAQSVTLIEAGVLKSFVLGRTPSEGFPHSNGHGRNAYYEEPAGRLATLIVEGKNPVADAELETKLRAEAERQGKPFGIWIEEMTPTDFRPRRGSQTFHGNPARIYKVDTRTGARTRVRGVELIGTPLTVLGRLLTTGTTRKVESAWCRGGSGTVPISMIAPGIVLQEVELQRTPERKMKAPFLPPPVFDRAAASK